VEQRGDMQQVPKPPGPGPGVPPGNMPPLPPAEIPNPDPGPLPIENPGDVPLPPITDPDVIEPREPNPVRRGPEYAASSSAQKAAADSRNDRSNLFSGSGLQRSMMEANLGISRTQTAPSRARP
jgi:hypothetical protein